MAHPESDLLKEAEMYCQFGDEHLCFDPEAKRLVRALLADIARWRECYVFDVAAIQLRAEVAEAHLRGQEAEQRWRDISTAPKDGTDMLVLHPDGSICISYWGCIRGVYGLKSKLHRSASGGDGDFCRDATHWMPLPPPPQAAGGQPNGTQEVPSKKADAAVPQKEKVCIWSQDDVGGDSTWETSCKNAFEFNDGSPLENGQQFCGYCGLQLVEQRTSDIVEPPASLPRVEQKS